jgi:hypothetical protein
MNSYVAWSGGVFRSMSHFFRNPVDPAPEVLVELEQIVSEIRLLVNEDPPTQMRPRSGARLWPDPDPRSSR